METGKKIDYSNTCQIMTSKDDIDVNSLLSGHYKI